MNVDVGSETHKVTCVFSCYFKCKPEIKLLFLSYSISMYSSLWAVQDTHTLWSSYNEGASAACHIDHCASLSYILLSYSYWLWQKIYRCMGRQGQIEDEMNVK